jgi:DNA-binding TFAR19-related protein (PDSD5 family)
MAKLIESEKKQKAAREQSAKVEVERQKLLLRYLAADAKQYLDGLKSRAAGIAKQIEEILLYLIVYRGFRQTITQLDIRYIERQLKGEGPQIKIQRDGETSDFGAYVREAIKKDSKE